MSKIIKIKGNPRLKDFIDVKPDGVEDKSKEKEIEIKGNPRLRDFVDVKSDKYRDVKKRKKEGNEEIKIKGSPPVQIAIKEYYRRQGLLKERLDSEEEDLRDKYKNIARVSLPRDYTYLQKTRKKRKRRMVFSKAIRFDFLTLRLVRVLSRIMGISQSDFIRRAIISYARFIYDFLPEDDKEKIEKGEI